MTHNIIYIMMDDYERQQFKGMFRILVLQLDVIVFMIALAIVIGVIPPSTWTPKIPIIIVASCIAGVFLVFFIRRYRATKAWLGVHGTTKAERKAAAQAQIDAERARIRAELEAELREEIEAEQRAKEAGLKEKGM